MSKPPRDETAPEWLNEAFLEEALRKGFKNDEFKILESERTMATAVAENYASQLFRFKLSIKRKKDSQKEDFSILVKLVTPGKIGEEMQKFQIYEKEAEAFTVLLPAIHNLLVNAFPDHKKLWADCYYYQNLPYYVLILEDLRVKGYTIANRFEGLDMEHTVLALKSLAKLHASSLVLKRNNPDIFNNFLENCWQPKNAEAMVNMLKNPFKIMAEDVLEWSECEKRELYSKKLKNLEETAMNRVFDSWAVDDSKLNVLLHGDAWLNNFMFKYDPNGKLSGINFVDFQLMNVNCAPMDLQYFIFTSVSPKIRFDQIDFFLETYHEAFTDAIKRLNYTLEKPFTLEQLKKDFNDKYFWGLTVFCVVFPIFLVPPEEAFNADEFIENENTENFKGTYKRKSMRDILIRGFQFFEEKGVF